MVTRMAGAFTSITAAAAWLAVAGAAAAQTGAAIPNRDSSGPQTAVPAPVARGQADVPGGTSKNGVIAPPAGATATMPIVTPRARGNMPVITPPGTGGRGGTVQPK